MEVTGVLKKAQMLPLSLYGIVYRTKLICFIQEAVSPVQNRYAGEARYGMKIN
jgi:hypothetical protein